MSKGTICKKNRSKILNNEEVMIVWLWLAIADFLVKALQINLYTSSFLATHGISTHIWTCDDKNLIESCSHLSELEVTRRRRRRHGNKHMNLSWAILRIKQPILHSSFYLKLENNVTWDYRSQTWEVGSWGINVILELLEIQISQLKPQIFTKWKESGFE